jgi:hypothetical protein
MHMRGGEKKKRRQQRHVNARESTSRDERLMTFSSGTLADEESWEI